MTKHYDPSDPQNKLETVIFVDGLGRVLQTKKDVAIYQVKARRHRDDGGDRRPGPTVDL